MHCSNCGAYYSKVTRFCSKCGEELASPSGVLDASKPYSVRVVSGNAPVPPEIAGFAGDGQEADPDAGSGSKYIVLGAALSLFLWTFGFVACIFMSVYYKNKGFLLRAKHLTLGAAIGFVFSTAIFIIGVVSLVFISQ